MYINKLLWQLKLNNLHHKIKLLLEFERKYVFLFKI